MIDKSERAAPKGPLSGVFVLDLSRVLAGPTATQILADLGADVVKVERRGEGDDTRRWGPPFVRSVDGGEGEASYYLGANRNKRSIAIDIAHPRGAALIRDLAASADVFTENFKTGGLARYGLDYPSLAAINPRLVYCSITGFGQTGPLASQPGYDFVMQAMGGLMSITGNAGEVPMKTGVAVADLMTGVYASSAILAALIEARASGLGQHVDMALFDVQVSMLANQASSFLATDRVPARTGNAHPSLAPYELLPTASEDIVIAVGNDQQFRNLVEVLGIPALADDPRFVRNAGRVVNRPALVAALTAALAGQEAEIWIPRLTARGVPCGPVNRIDEVFAHPQAQARGLIVEQDRADLADPVRTVASPIRLSRTPVDYRLPPPGLGEHTAFVLRDRLGLDDDALADLVAIGVIG
ncbi:CaiB/BaiF CoA transferase family protein [Sphingomonas sp. MMS24-J13]|uniref:CaiB/BaiF CoA transferase family protein n=1 Tax=Sphingomonas sp. MMS24-J13 TaxID=3238686 RepID=UPI00384B3D43